MENCIRIRSISPFHNRYIFVDTKDYVSARVFAENDIRPSHIKEMVNPKTPFRLIICSIKKRDTEKFIGSLETLKNRILLLGYRDYDETCAMLQKAIEAAATT